MPEVQQGASRAHLISENRFLMSLFQNLRVWPWTVSGTEEVAQAGLAVEVTPMTTAARRKVSMALRRWVEAGTPEATGGRLEEVFRPEEEVSLVLACPLLLSPSYCRLRNARIRSESTQSRKPAAEAELLLWRCLFLSVGHDGYRDGQQMHEGSTPTGRERPSSMQGMDMASLPPRKRPWQDGPGTGDPRDHESERPDGGERRVFSFALL